MNFNEWWQESKRFVVIVACGVIVFVIGNMLIDHFFKQELNRNKATLTSSRTKLEREPLYDATQLTALQQENAALLAATATLRQAVQHEPRPAFRYDAQKGAAANQYFQTVSSVREELLTLAGRSNLRLPENIGLPALSPTREPDIVRYLAGFDVVDRIVRMALAAGVERIDKLEIKLDPKLNSKEGVGAFERTRIEVSMSGKPGPLVQFLQLSQDPQAGGPLVLSKSEMQPARTKTDEAGLEVVFEAVQLHDSEPAKDK